MLSVFDDIERQLDEWNKKESKKEDIEDSNAIPPRKESIAEKIDKLGRTDSSKKQQQTKDKRGRGDSNKKQIQFEVPWKHSKKMIKDFKKMIGF